MKRRKLAVLDLQEDATYSDAFQYYMNNVRRDSKRADAYAWRHTVAGNSRLKAFDGARPHVGLFHAFKVVSPDGIPIQPEPFATRREADKALAAWCSRYQRQGYYASATGRISLDDLPGRCSITITPKPSTEKTS